MDNIKNLCSKNLQKKVNLPENALKTSKKYIFMKTFYLLGVVNPLNIFLLSIFLQFCQGPKSKKKIAIFPTAAHRPVLIGRHFNGPKK
jgi:hypothetical protein